MNHSLIEIEPLKIQLNNSVEIYDAEIMLDLLHKVMARQIHY